MVRCVSVQRDSVQDLAHNRSNSKEILSQMKLDTCKKKSENFLTFHIFVKKIWVKIFYHKKLILSL